MDFFFFLYSFFIYPFLFTISSKKRKVKEEIRHTKKNTKTTNSSKRLVSSDVG